MLREKVSSDILPHFAHCLTKIFLCPLQASLFLRFCTGLSSKPATSLIRSGAGAEQGIVREKEEDSSRGKQGGVVCRLHQQIARCTFPEEGSVAKSLRYQARREVLQQMAPQYRQASP